MTAIMVIRNLCEYTGHENLEIISQNISFNEWMYEEILPGLKGDILEVGSGIGTFSEKIVRDFPHSHIMLTDVSLSYVKDLAQRFSGNNISVGKLDLNCETDYGNIGYEKFDSIIAINVLEHIENDELVLAQLYRMLKKEGVLILLVPCHKFLYNILDVNVGHYRRYSKKDLEDKIMKTPFIVDRMYYFNIIGIIGWYLNGNIAKNPKINTNASKIFDRIVPILRIIERLIGRKTGLSIICYLRKNH